MEGYRIFILKSFWHKAVWAVWYCHKWWQLVLWLKKKLNGTAFNFLSKAGSCLLTNGSPSKWIRFSDVHADLQVRSALKPIWHYVMDILLEQHDPCEMTYTRWQYHEESLEEKEIKLFYPHTTYPRAKPEVSPGRNLSCTCSLGPIMQTLLSMGNFIRGKSNFFGFMRRWATFIGMHESRLQRHRCSLLHRNDAPPLFFSSSVEIEYFPFA